MDHGGQMRRDRLDDRGLDRPNIGHDRAGLKVRPYFPCDHTHDAHGSAENDEIGGLDRGSRRLHDAIGEREFRHLRADGAG